MGTWGYGKIALLVEAKIFSYKINLILCHNVNFDVTIMTSRRHFFWSTLGWFCRQIISRKSQRRNFLNLLPFKSYKQKSKSCFISPPPYRIRVNSVQVQGHRVQIQAPGQRRHGPSHIEQSRAHIMLTMLTLGALRGPAGPCRALPGP